MARPKSHTVKRHSKLIKYPVNIRKRIQIASAREGKDVNGWIVGLMMDALDGGQKYCLPYEKHLEIHDLARRSDMTFKAYMDNIVTDTIEDQVVYESAEEDSDEVLHTL